MKTKKSAALQMILFMLLITVLIGVVWYMAFYTPLQNELAGIERQIQDTNAQGVGLAAQLDKLGDMKAELDILLSKPAGSITEIAPYDNRNALLDELNGILAATESYSLSFGEPADRGDGIMLRTVSINYVCQSYAAAKNVLKALDTCHWRCALGSVSISGGENMSGAVSVNTTGTFYESKNLK